MERWRFFALPCLLERSVDRILAEQGLIQTQGLAPKIQLSMPKTLTAWMHVTNACNLDCPYCYVRKSSARMSESIGFNAVNKIFQTAQQNEYQRVKLKYAGGEATLQFKLVRNLHQYAQRKAIETELKLNEVILSNGVRIRSEDADWIAEQGVKLMVSLDGIGDIHNQQRPLKGGGSTSHKIEETIEKTLLTRNIYPDISITITNLNAESVADTVRWALERICL